MLSFIVEYGGKVHGSLSHIFILQDNSISLLYTTKFPWELDDEKQKFENNVARNSGFTMK